MNNMNLNNHLSAGASGKAPEAFAPHLRLASPAVNTVVPKAEVMPLAGAVYAALLDHIDVGMIVCNAEGHLLYANSEAEAELDRGELLQRGLCEDGLEGVRAACGNTSDQALLAAVQGAAVHGRRRMVSLQLDDSRMLITAVPLSHQGHESIVLLMLGRRSLCSQLGLDMLALTHGLTPAEGRVMSGLLAGHSAAEIATDSQVCISTVRTQICAIRDKLGVRSMRQLLLRAACVPPAASALQQGGSAWCAAA